MAWTSIEPYSDRGADPAFRVSDADAILANLEALAAAVSVRSLGGSDVASPGLTDQWVDVIGAREQLLSTATAGLVRQAGGGSRRGSSRRPASSSSSGRCGFGSPARPCWRCIRRR